MALGQRWRCSSPCPPRRRCRAELGRSRGAVPRHRPGGADCFACWPSAPRRRPRTQLGRPRRRAGLGLRPSSGRLWASDPVSTPEGLDLRSRLGHARSGCAPASSCATRRRPARQRLDLNTVAAKLGDMRRLRVRADGATVPARPAPARPSGSRLDPALEPGDTRTVVVFRVRLRTTSAARTFFFTRIPWRGTALSRHPLAQSGHPVLRAGSWRALPDAGQPARRGHPELRPKARVGHVRSPRPSRRPAHRETHRASDVRDFVITASPGYRVTRGTSRDGQTGIVAYTRRASGRRWIRPGADRARPLRSTSPVCPIPTPPTGSPNRRAAWPWRLRRSSGSPTPQPGRPSLPHLP